MAGCADLTETQQLLYMMVTEAWRVLCMFTCTVLQLKQEVESLLQRTDSILSRSSNNSTRHGASGAHLQG